MFKAALMNGVTLGSMIGTDSILMRAFEFGKQYNWWVAPSL